MGTIACVPEVDFSPKPLPELLLALRDNYLDQYGSHRLQTPTTTIPCIQLVCSLDVVPKLNCRSTEKPKQ